MSQRFNLTAQLQLQAPTNVGQVVGQIRRQLQGINVNVQVQGNTRNLAVINRQMQGVRDNAGAASRNVGALNRNLAEAARRFSVITVATGTMLALARSIKDGVGEAIQFERELVKISQVTGKSVNQLQGLTKEVTRLSTSLGASSSDLLNVSRVLAQAGFAADKTKQALDILAKTSLAATFDSIQDTTEGAIAVLRQFRAEARQAGGDIKFLEQTMDAINSVSKNFAVESGDLITVIRRTGGVFEAAGGSVNELIALFTSVRATTRESAETISTGLRTIFTRVQRTDTVNQLKSLGIELRNAEGQFVGAFEAFRRLSVGLSSLDPKDWRFSEIVESLGGFRQIGKVIPLVRQFTTAQDALNVAQASSGSVARDAATAQQSLYQQAQKVGQEFKALMRSFTDSGTFRSIATGALELAKAFIRIADALEPLLPMIGILAGMKIGQAVGPMLGGLMAGRGRGGGGRGISRFAGGGHVPGSGNRDTVPAMLTPGEFVIKKSSARKLGPATLSAMNNNRYANAGKVRVSKTGKINKGDLAKSSDDQLSQSLDNRNLTIASRALVNKEIENRKNKSKDKNKKAVLKSGTVGGLFLQSGGPTSSSFSKDIKEGAFKGRGKLANIKKMEGSIYTGTLDKRASKSVRDQLEPALESAVLKAASQTISKLEISPLNIDENRAAKTAVKKVDTRAIEGFVFEAFISAMSGARMSDAGATFDFANPSKASRKRLANIFGPDPLVGRLFDAKRTLSRSSVQSDKSSIANKIIAGAKQGQLTDKDFTIRKFASGGQVDNVPALLTPGEFVINKKSAQSIGYSNLRGMNRSGVSKFAVGGMVGLAGGQKTGAASFRGLGAAGVAQFEAENKAAAQRMKAYTRSVGQSQAAMIAYSRAISSGQSVEKALVRARAAAAHALQEEVRLTERLGDATEQEIQQLNNSQPGQQQQPGLMGRMAGGINTSLNQLQPVMNAAQSFVFAGAMAGSLASQFSGLDKVTKQIITEFSGFLATFIGLGATVTQVFASLIQTVTASSVANAVETQASLAAAEADGIEALNSGGMVAAMTPLTAIIAGLGIAITGVVSYYKYLEISSNALADSFKEAGDRILEALEKGTGTGAGLRETTIKELRERQRGEAQAFHMEDIVPLMIQSWDLGQSLAENRLRRRDEIVERGQESGSEGALIGSIDALVGMTGELKRFKDELSDIDKAKLEPAEETRRRQENLQLDRFSGIQGAIKEREALATRKEVLPSQLKESDFADDDIGLITFKHVTKVINKAMEGLEEQEKSARDTLQKTMDLPDVKSGKFSHEDLMTSNAAYKTSVEQSTAAIKANHDAIILSLQIERDLAKAKLNEVTNANNFNKFDTATRQAAADSYKLANDQLVAAQGRQRLAIEDNTNSIENSTQGYQDALAADLQAAAAATELRKRLEEISQFAKTMKSLEMGLNSMERSIDNMDAMINNTTTSFKSLDIGLGDLSTIPNMEDFEKNITTLADQFNVPENIKNDLLAMAKLQGGGRKAILKKFGKEREGEAAPTVQQILEAGGVGEVWDRLGDETKKEMRKAIDIGIGRGLTDDMLDAILKPFFDDKTMKQIHGSFQGLQKLFDREMQLEQKRLARLEKFADMQIEANQKVIDAEIRGAEAIAQARGIELSTIQKEGARRRQAQVGLTGTNLMAGDAAGAGALIRRNQAELKRVRAEKDDPRNLFKTKQLATEEQQLITSTKKATSELDRLADQSGLLADIESDISKERDKRESISNIFEDFAFGGLQERRDILAGIGGIRAAMATGTVQNQSQAQRVLTRQMLDSLADVPIGPGGETGEQIKKWLAANDMVRMGLISQQQRDAILTATTTEEKLIIALHQLTLEMRRAAMMRAAAAPQGVFAKGGYMSGPSHSRGGIPIEVEGGEYIFDKGTVSRLGAGNVARLHKGRAAITPNRPKFQDGGAPKTVKEVVEEFDKAPIWLDEAQDLMIANDKLKTQGPSLAKRIGNVGKKITKIGSKILSKADLVGTTAEVMTSDVVRDPVEKAGGVVSGVGRGVGSVLHSLFTGKDITTGLAESAIASERRGRDAGSVNRGQGGFITGSSYGKVLNPNEVIGSGAGTQTSALNAMAMVSEFFLGGGSGPEGPRNVQELVEQRGEQQPPTPFEDVKDLNRTLAGMTGPIDGLKRAFLAGEITQKQFTDGLKTHETKVFGRLDASEGPLQRQRASVDDKVRGKFDPILTIAKKEAADEVQMRAEQKAGEKRQAESIKRRMAPVSEGGGGYGLGGSNVGSGDMHLTEEGWRYSEFHLPNEDGPQLSPSKQRDIGMETFDESYSAAKQSAGAIEEMSKTDYMGRARPADETADQRAKRLGIGKYADSGLIDTFTPTPLSEIKADPEPPAPKKRETIMEKRARLLTQEQDARTRRGGGPGARAKATKFGGSNAGTTTEQRAKNREQREIEAITSGKKAEKYPPNLGGGVFNIEDSLLGPPPAAPKTLSADELRAIRDKDAGTVSKRGDRKAGQPLMTEHGYKKPAKEGYGVGSAAYTNRSNEIRRLEEEENRKAAAATGTAGSPKIQLQPSPHDMLGPPPAAPKVYDYSEGGRDITAGGPMLGQLKSRKQILKARQQGGMEQLRQQQAAGGAPGAGPAQFTPFSERSRSRAYTPLRRGASGKVSGGQEFRNAGYVARQKRFDKFGIDPTVSRQGGASRDAMIQATGYATAGAARRAGHDPQALAQGRAQDQFQQQQQQQQAAAGGAAGGAAPGAQTMDGLNKIVSQLETNFQSIVEKFSTLEHNHTFSGEIGIQVNIGNKDAIIAAIRTGIEEDIRNEIARQKGQTSDLDSTGNGGGGNGG